MTATPLDYELLAAQWLRAMRGKRSQRALSRRLGYRTNIAYRWESGRCWPTASNAMRALKKLGWNLQEALIRFEGRSASWAKRCDLTTREGIVTLLDELRQRVPVVAIARVTGHSRFAVARWLKGQAEPRLPELLQLIDACSLRLLDFVAQLFTPAQVPLLAARMSQLQAVRRAAYSEPLSHAVLRALELESYASLPRHRKGWLAKRLDITLEDEERCLSALADAGQIHRQGARWRVAEQAVVDTRAEPDAARALKAFWARRAVGALEAGMRDQENVFTFNLMSVSEADLERLRDLTRRYFREMRAIVAESQPNERVVLYCGQLVVLDKEQAR
jgi:hypothetical protein